MRAAVKRRGRAHWPGALAGGRGSVTSSRRVGRHAPGSALDELRITPHGYDMMRSILAVLLSGALSVAVGFRADAQTDAQTPPQPSRPLLPQTVAGADVSVDVELLLAVDVSFSMTPRELEIQRKGYAAALRDPAILEAILGGYHQRVAIAYVEWSGVGQQREVAPWTLVASADDLDGFAASLTVTYRPALRRTSISSVLDFAPNYFETNGFAGDRRVIDVSGDGPNNMGRPVLDARAELLEAGYAINGLPLMTHEGEGQAFHLDDLDLYYRHCVIGGPMSFSLPVRSWDEFIPAVRQKLIFELAGYAPEPKQTPARWRTGRAVDHAPGFDCLIGEKMWRRFMERGGGASP